MYVVRACWTLKLCRILAVSKEFKVVYIFFMVFMDAIQLRDCKFALKLFKVGEIVLLKKELINFYTPIKMKKLALLAVAVGAVAMTSCKSKEDMYRKMYEEAKAQQTTVDQTKTVVVAPAETTKTVVTPTQTTTQTTTVTPVDLSGTRQIQGGITVVSGEQLKEFSVVVGSFQTQANAEGLKSLLQQKGYSSRVIRTNETINGHTGWFRVIAASFSDKASAAQLRDQMKGDYPGAWLLYKK